ncbi:MAG: hydantoinase B/oxoprolinase family protein [Chloroflexi bacterium]|nr:hydantoinase B/oxoprolinase family protein [Chloroflexota bacterium]
MGAALGRSAFSPNIKERRDYSCAVFDVQGRLIAQAAHIPVHLGAMPASVQSALTLAPFAPGDVILLNDPFAGGTHLPDWTVVTPVFAGGMGSPCGYVASRAHHADVGGMTPGSLPLSREIYAEGLILPPVKLFAAGRRNEALWRVLLANTRTPGEREGDLAAQLAAGETGGRRLQSLIHCYGLPTVNAHATALLEYGARLARATIRAIPDGTYRFTDYLDDDGQGQYDLPITVTITVVADELTIDFAGSASECGGSLNAVAAICQSACLYCVRCLMPPDAPTNEGMFEPLHIVMPHRSIVNACRPRAVAAGNVETSQRIVDAVFGALAQAVPGQVPAASQGTMNNTLVGGTDPHSGEPFTYYETIAGGGGALQQLTGLSGKHSHMTNTLNTPIEALEAAYPLRCHHYGLRWGSGGAGRWHGGDGVVRTLEFLAPAAVTVLSERRRHAPYGLAGGEPGLCGRHRLEHRDGSFKELPGKVTVDVQPGDVLAIKTPGGGGWGPLDDTGRHQ